MSFLVVFFPTSKDWIFWDDFGGDGGDRKKTPGKKTPTEKRLLESPVSSPFQNRILKGVGGGDLP